LVVKGDRSTRRALPEILDSPERHAETVRGFEQGEDLAEAADEEKAPISQTGSAEEVH